jgi:hypothetical protein
MIEGKRFLSSFFDKNPKTKKPSPWKQNQSNNNNNIEELNRTPFACYRTQPYPSLLACCSPEKKGSKKKGSGATTLQARLESPQKNP